MARRPLNILCFGDSLTSGYYCYGAGEHPYSIRLEDRLCAAMRGTKVQVFTNGDPGALVSDRWFKTRLQVELEKRQYDWVIILGGTNDIASMISADETFEALQELWEIALAKGSKVLALSVPECAAQIGWLNAARDDLNQHILTYKAPNVHTFDLKARIPYHALTEDEQSDRWDDGLHLTPEGYNWMGNHIADALLPLLQQDGQPARARSHTTRKSTVSPDDHLVFDEESENSKDISQGYVVIRKRDLH